MNYSIIYDRYYVLGGTSPNYWGNGQPVLGEPLGRFRQQEPLRQAWLGKIRKLQWSQKQANGLIS